MRRLCRCIPAASAAASQRQPCSNHSAAKRGHQLRGFDRSGLLSLRSERALPVAGKEREDICLVAQLLDQELLNGVRVGVQVKEPEAVEVAGKYPPRNLGVGKIIDVVQRLLLGCDEIFPRRLHLDQREARNQRVDVAAGTG
ncbi:MAG: hypothetical protein J0I43_16235 [Microbacterium sp.]|nr:hypothetical protein [Microbacterium sp.]MBN9178898.1 hypothetical protein [Microbacterium sp.]